MTIDVEIGKSGPIGGVEQFSRACQIDQNVGLGRPSPTVAILLHDGLVKGRHVAAGLLQLRSKQFKSGPILFFH